MDAVEHIKGISRSINRYKNKSVVSDDRLMTRFKAILGGLRLLWYKLPCKRFSWLYGVVRVVKMVLCFRGIWQRVEIG